MLTSRQEYKDAFTKICDGNGFGAADEAAFHLYVDRCYDSLQRFYIELYLVCNHNKNETIYDEEWLLERYNETL